MTRRIVEVEGRSIGVFNVGGEFFAIRNRCPHQGGPLCEGVQVGALTSDGPGEYLHERPGEIIRCPWHAWEFDLRTGRSWFDPKRRRVRAYDVALVPGDQLDAEPPAAGPACPARTRPRPWRSPSRTSSSCWWMHNS